MRVFRYSAVACLLSVLVAAGGCKKSSAAREGAEDSANMPQATYYEESGTSPFIESVSDQSFDQSIGQPQVITPAPAVPESYTIRKGDTLWSVAKQVYGDGTRWPDIANANAISNPKKLLIGQRLIIP